VGALETRIFGLSLSTAREKSEVDGNAKLASGKQLADGSSIDGLPLESWATEKSAVFDKHQIIDFS